MLGRESATCILGHISSRNGGVAAAILLTMQRLNACGAKGRKSRLAGESPGMSHGEKMRFK